MKWYLPAVLLGLTSAGCIFVANNKTYSPPPAEVVYIPVPAGATTQQAIAADLQARMDAAATISAFTERDAVLARIANDAAACGDVEFTRKALQGISQFTVRDDAAATACLKLAHRGHRAEAIEIAQTMAQFTRRDETLRQLAGR